MEARQHKRWSQNSAKCNSHHGYSNISTRRLPLAIYVSVRVLMLPTVGVMLAEVDYIQWSRASAYTCLLASVCTADKCLCNANKGCVWEQFYNRAAHVFNKGVKGVGCQQT